MSIPAIVLSKRACWFGPVNANSDCIVRKYSNIYNGRMEMFNGVGLYLKAFLSLFSRIGFLSEINVKIFLRGCIFREMFTCVKQ